MTLASKFTIARIILAPLFVIIAAIGLPHWNLWAAGIFIIASLTDCIDGQIARRYNQVSDFGKLIDPIADKLLTTAAMVVIVAWGKMPSWVAMILITRDVVVNSLRVVAAERGFILAAMNSGKIKTVLQLVAYVLYLFEWQLAAHIVMGAACLTTLWSLFEYVGANRSLFGRDRTCTRSFIAGFIDKLVLSYLVFYLTGTGALPAILAMCFIGRDHVTSALRVTSAADGRTLPIRFSGLLKGFLQLVTFILLLFMQNTLTTVLIYITLTVTLLSAVDLWIIAKPKLRS